MVVQSDGKIGGGGLFTTVNGAARNRIARLNADGSLDTGFNPGSGTHNPVRAVAALGDGKIIVGGFFTSINGVARNYLARLNGVTPAGSGHPAFFAGEVPLANGVYYLQFPSGNPFGYSSYLSDPRYLFHQDLGYEFVFDAGDGKGGVYLYDFASGSFFYTSPGFPFPDLYDFSLGATLYYYPPAGNPGRYTCGPRYFFNFGTGQIISK